MDVEERPEDTDPAARLAEQLSEYIGEVDEYVEENVAPLLETYDEDDRSDVEPPRAPSAPNPRD